MKITSVYIPNLWGKYNITWNLKEHVNILSGINGSGKSTILRAMASVLRGESLPLAVSKRMSGIILQFDSGYTLKLNIQYDKAKSKGKTNNNENQPINFLKQKNSEQKIGEFEEFEVELINRQQLSLSDAKNNKLDVSKFLAELKVGYISTFDCAPQRPDDPKVYFDYLLNSSYSELDRHLENVVDRYKTYQIELSTRVTKMMSETKSRSDKNRAFIDIETLISRRSILQDIIDDLMKESGKHVNREKGDLEFVFHSDNSSHIYKDLSAGEKQLLLILLTVFMQENDKAILIMDEPEISLHVDWQRRIIDIIRQLNPNCQIIVSTHSPAMILNGWHSAVANISDLAKQN